MHFFGRFAINTNILGVFLLTLGIGHAMWAIYHNDPQGTGIGDYDHHAEGYHEQEELTGYNVDDNHNHYAQGHSENLNEDDAEAFRMYFTFDSGDNDFKQPSGGRTILPNNNGNRQMHGPPAQVKSNPVTMLNNRGQGIPGTGQRTAGPVQRTAGPGQRIASTGPSNGNPYTADRRVQPPQSVPKLHSGQQIRRGHSPSTNQQRGCVCNPNFSNAAGYEEQGYNNFGEFDGAISEERYDNPNESDGTIDEERYDHDESEQAMEVHDIEPESWYTWEGRDLYDQW